MAIAIKDARARNMFKHVTSIARVASTPSGCLSGALSGMHRPSVWGGRPAFRLSVSFWRTENADIERLILQLTGLRAERERPLLHSAPK